MFSIHYTEALVRDHHHKLHEEAAHRRLLRDARRVPSWRRRAGRVFVRIGRRLDPPRTGAATSSTLTGPRTVHRQACG